MGDDGAYLVAHHRMNRLSVVGRGGQPLEIGYSVMVQEWIQT